VRYRVGWLVLTVLAFFAQPAASEVREVKIARAVSVAYLPLMVMEHDRLLEKHARAAGLGDIKVEWSTYSGGTAINDALLSGNLHFASSGVTPFLILWSRTQGNLDVRAIAAMNRTPLYLNTRNPDIKNIRDFTDKDRIAVLAPKSALQAILLQMAAAQAFGQEHYAKLDPISVGLPLPDALAALLSGAAGVTADFTVPPFAYQERETPGVHTVLSSNDILGGGATFALAYTTSKFREENPKIYAAFEAALKDAIDRINADKKRAADIYVEVSKQKTTAAELNKLLSDPEITYELAPRNLMKYADFMSKVGIMKQKPGSWTDLFFPGHVQTLPGS
jgi:sulfonate transport system substrate-binding protein